MDRIRKFGACARLHGGGVAGEREQCRGERRHGRNERNAADAQDEREALGRDAGKALPSGHFTGVNSLDRDHSEAAQKRDPQRDVHRRVGPVNRRPVVRKAPDDDRAQSAQQPEVLDPVKRREDEIRTAAHDAAAMIPPPRTRLPEYRTAAWPGAAPRNGSSSDNRPARYSPGIAAAW